MKYLIGLVFCVFSSQLLAEETPNKTIDKVQFDANSGHYYAYNTEGWEVCNNTKHVQLRGSVEYKNIFIGQVLAAHMAQKTVQFSGGCTNSNGYLDATYIKIDK